MAKPIKSINELEQKVPGFIVNTSEKAMTVYYYLKRRIIDFEQIEISCLLDKTKQWEKVQALTVHEMLLKRMLQFFWIP